MSLITDPQEILEYMHEGIGTTAPTEIWVEGQRHIATTTLRDLDRKSDYPLFFYTSPVSEKDEDLLQQDLRKSVGSKCCLSFSTSRAKFYIVARFKKFGGDGVYFQFPGQLYKVQRRNAIRYAVSIGRIFDLEFQHPKDEEKMLTAPVLDLSAIGLSFSVPTELAADFEVGMVIKHLKFELSHKKFDLDAVVQHIHFPEAGKIEPPRIGVSFKNVKPGQQSFIGSYVFERIRRALVVRGLLE